MSIQNLDDIRFLVPRRTPRRAGVFKFAMLTVIALAFIGSQPAHATASAEAAADADEAATTVPANSVANSESEATQPRGRPIRRTGALDSRINLLAKELDLSPVQQKQVKKVLLAQRDQVSAVWNDTSVPAALRVSRTQAIGDHTANQIRALLNSAQREKYIKPRMREASVGSAGANVEKWTPPGKAK